MTHAVDKILAKSGFDIHDVQAISSRQWLYVGIFAMALAATSFAALSISIWF